MQYDLIVSKNPMTGLLEVAPVEQFIDRDADNDISIVWTLDPETLPNAKFSRSSRPITWEKDPPWHIIKRQFEIEDEGRSLRVSDRHTGSATVDLGGYKYLLKVVERSSGGSRSLSSGFSSPARPITSPVIINR